MSPMGAAPFKRGDTHMATSTLGKSAAANAPMTGEEKKVIFASSLGTVFELML